MVVHHCGQEQGQEHECSSRLESCEGKLHCTLITVANRFRLLVHPDFGKISTGRVEDQNSQCRKTSFDRRFRLIAQLIVALRVHRNSN